jgi:hypothetical protein
MMYNLLFFNSRMQPIVAADATGVRQELTIVNSRLDVIEDMVHDLLESGQHLDEKLTAQLEDVRHEIQQQHQTIKKLRRGWCTRPRCSLRMLSIGFLILFSAWVLLAFF